MRKRVIYTMCIAVIFGLGACSIHVHYPAIDPIKPFTEAQAIANFPPAMVERGKMLAAAGYCSNCHTSPGAAPFAGNYKMQTQFGSIYSSNITPDADTGIGHWSEAAFARAMRLGVSRDGHHLFPAFPYEHFNKMTDEDINAIYAFIMTSVPAVHQEKKENGIPFPLNIRWLQAGWKLLFADTSQFEPRKDKSKEWNRGAYLAEGITHCGACHTPRNFLGGEKYDHMYEGAQIDGWIAPSLTSTNKAPLPWRLQDFYAYLATGNALYHGSAAGPMAPVIHEGLAALPNSDLVALSTYFGDIAGNVQQDLSTNSALEAAIVNQAEIPDSRIDQGARLYKASCQSCHFSGKAIMQGRMLLSIDTSTHLDEPTNLIHVILDGFSAEQGIKGVVMPGFRDALSVDDITAIATYLRATAGEKPWPNLKSKVGEIRLQPRLEH